MKSISKYILSGIFFSVIFYQSAFADNWTEKITIKGFASAVYQQTDDPVFFNGDCTRTFSGMMGMTAEPCDGIPGGAPGTVNGITPTTGSINEDGSFRRTRIGLNINANINDRITVQSQFLVSEEEEEYRMHLDWGFISLALDDSNSIRAGKIKLPIGLFNEYQSVGYSFPWIEVPQLFYTSDFNGPNATRESYRGLSYLWQGYNDDWAFTSDLFYGDIALEGMALNGVLGYTFRAEWDNSVYMQASAYSGTMKYEPRMIQMLDKKHRVRTIGLGSDLSGFLFYAEYARVTMGMDMQEAKTWYASIGHQFEGIALLLTHQNMEKGVDIPDAMKNKQTMDTVTLRYDIAHNTALKFELSQIETDLGVGLFAAGAPTDTKPADNVKMFGMAIDVLF